MEGQSIRVYRSNTDGEILDPEVYPITGENPFNLLVEDFTADGRPDLLYLNNDGKQSLALRQQLEDGSFGPELRQAMDRPARTLHAMSAVGNTRAQLVSVDSRSGFLEFLELTQNGSPEGVEVIRPEVYPFSVKGGEGVRYAFGDFDKDGDFDVVIADSAKAEVMLFSYAEGRFGTSVSFPSFSTISSLAAGRFFHPTGDQLIVLSKEEKTLGLSLLNESGRLDFPVNIGAGQGEPLVAETLDFDADGYDELALVSLDENGDYVLSCSVLWTGARCFPNGSRSFN